MPYLPEKIIVPVSNSAAHLMEGGLEEAQLLEQQWLA
jgi:hypothetical protein